MARSRRAFTSREVQLALRMRTARATTLQIATALRTSESTVKRRFRDLLGERPRGPAPTVWGEREQSQVMNMAAYGIPRATIARIMGISAQRLRAEFADDLLKGSTLANYAVAKSLFEMATTGRNPTAAIFWVKARMGWRDRDPIRKAGAPGADSRELQVHALDLGVVVARLSPEGRRALRVVLSEMRETEPRSTADHSPASVPSQAEGGEAASRANRPASRILGGARA